MKEKKVRCILRSGLPTENIQAVHFHGTVEDRFIHRKIPRFCSLQRSSRKPYRHRCSYQIDPMRSRHACSCLLACLKGGLHFNRNAKWETCDANDRAYAHILLSKDIAKDVS